MDYDPQCPEIGRSGGELTWFEEFWALVDARTTLVVEGGVVHDVGYGKVEVYNLGITTAIEDQVVKFYVPRLEEYNLRCN